MVNQNFNFGEEKAAKALNSFLPQKHLETFANAHGLSTTNDVCYYTINAVDGNPTSISLNNRTVRSSSNAFRDIGNNILDFTGYKVPEKKADNIPAYYSETIRVLKKDKKSSTVSSNENDLEHWEGTTSYTTSINENATTNDAITIYKASSKGHAINYPALAIEFVTVPDVGKVRRCTFLTEMKSDDHTNTDLTNKVLTNMTRALLKALQ